MPMVSGNCWKTGHMHCHYCGVIQPIGPNRSFLGGYIHLKIKHPDVWARDLELREEFVTLIHNEQTLARMRENLSSISDLVTELLREDR